VHPRAIRGQRFHLLKSHTDGIELSLARGVFREQALSASLDIGPVGMQFH
jgi:hypothetical protein